MSDSANAQNRAPQVSAAPKNPEYAEKGKTALIADDNMENLSILCRMLEHACMRVRIARDGEQALASARAERPDIILLDVHMPRMDGYETCRRLLDTPQLSKVPVVFLSALASPLDKARAFEAGAVDYVEKPFLFVDVMLRVRSALRLGYYMRRCELLEARLAEYEGAKPQRDD